MENLPLYFTAKGGHDAWPTEHYLNIWVVEMSDRTGRVGMPGYSHFPGDDARIDGVVIDPRVFGTIPPLVEGHGAGRTATHEVGHWLNLVHIFAQRTCESSDFVDDTPSSAMSYYGKPAYPQSSCGHSTMFMNFMDYVDDDAMYMFSVGQKERMRAVFKPGGQRRGFCQDCK
ncbi:MAG: M43 family zinc metalloprotease [Bacteroidota bacterium]